jgi:diaminopimelate decarboxylase
MLFDLKTPAFVIDGDALFTRAICLSKAFNKCQFSYSVKTLAVPEAVQAAREAGWLIEVVSRDEFDFVRGIGIKPEEIIVNGPSKDDDLLRAALRGGAVVHADSEEELRRAAAIQAALGSGRIGVRLGLGVTDPRWARFGIDAGEVDAIVRLLAKACNGQSLRGFHVHSGTNRGSVQEFLVIAARAINFARAFASYTNTDIEWIDLGGGFPDRGVAPLGATAWDPPEIEQFAREALLLVQSLGTPSPLLMFEPGRALIGPCVDLYTRVETVKNVAGAQLATLDAGVNTLPFARTFSYPVELCDGSGADPMETVLCGPLCMVDDVIRYDAMLPPLKKGNLLRIRSVGAYNISMSFDFIRRRADILFVREQQTLKSRSMFTSE